MKPRVFIPQVPTRFDPLQHRTVPKFDSMDQAKVFGDLVILLDRNNDVWDPQSCIAKLRRGLIDFNWEKDFLLPMGSHHFMMWSAMLLSRSPKLNTLQWHSRNNEYVILQTVIVP